MEISLYLCMVTFFCELRLSFVLLLLLLLLSTRMSLFFSAHTEKKPDGKEESMDAVTVTALSIIYSEVGKPIDCFYCALKVVIAKSSSDLY